MYAIVDPLSETYRLLCLAKVMQGFAGEERPEEGRIGGDFSKVISKRAV